ncbi:MAG: DUF2946 family protein [Rhodoferax sp.]|nr:DUF2946 family protein [Rhodoferax sp.]MCF8211472.1 DUF2946 family protein [Rhodoferax sp.]
MDEMVQQAMAKWPNVPHCYGWLGLDMRGHWYLRDDGAQAAGAFASRLPGAKGSLLQHDKLISFIQRNYAHDDHGQWYFQNGPQRVYVELEVTPWVWRIAESLSVVSQTGITTHATRCMSDERGWVYLETPLGLGLVHTFDVETVAEALDSGHWHIERLHHSELPLRYGYVCSPATAQKKASASGAG